MGRIRSVDVGNPFLESLDGVCEVLLIRHGEQHYVENMPIVDAVDPPLSDLGQRQARAVGARLADVELAAVYASPLERALATGEAIARHRGGEVQPMDDIVEIGLWRDVDQHRPLVESVGRDQLRTILQEANRTRRWDAYPFSEPRDEFRTRVIAALDRVIADHHGERVAVACHGGVINAYLSHIFDSPYDQVCSIHHTSITTVRGAGDIRRVVQVNDYAHVTPFQDGLNPLNVT